VSVQSELLADDPVSASLISIFGIVNLAAFNALTQDKVGYFTVRWQSALSHVFWHGVPIVAVAASVLVALDCGQRPCLIGMSGAGYGADFFPVFCLVMTVPVVAFQIANAGISFSKTRNKTKPPPIDEDAVDEPEVLGYGSSEHAVAVCFSVLVCCLLWLCQLLAIVGMFWNMEERIRESYLRPLTALGWAGPVEYLNGYNHAKLIPNGDWGFIVPDASWRVGLIFWSIGMAGNLATTAAYVASRATRQLREKLSTSPAPVIVCLACSLFHPEAMLFVCDRRRDAHHFMIMGGVSAVTTNWPFFFIFFNLLTGDGSSESFVLLFTTFTFLHNCFYCIRAAIVAITRALRRPSDLKTYFWSVGDYALLALAFIQFVLLCLLGLCCLQGKAKGEKCRVPFEPGSGGVFDDFNRTQSVYEHECEPIMPKDQTNAMTGYFLWLAFFIVVYMAANQCSAYSFLNHFRFSHQWISDHPFKSTLVVILGTFDAEWLNGLAQEQNIRMEVKRTAMFISLSFLFPVTVVQVSIAFFTSIDWGLIEDSGLVMSPTFISGASFAFTVITAIARLLMLVVLQATRRAEGHTPGETDLINHALCCCCATWRKNRGLPEGYVPDHHQFNGETTRMPYHSRYHQRRSPFDAVDGTANTDCDVGPEARQIAYDEHGYPLPQLDEHGYPLQNLDEAMELPAEHELNPVMEAVCLRRALFMTPDGVQGVFVALPTSLDQPVPFLFVQALSVRPIRRRFGNARTAQVTFTFNSVDVGGLDVDFIQQNVFNDPESAWRQLEELDRSGGEYEQPLQQPNDSEDDGIHVDRPSTDDPRLPAARVTSSTFAL